MLNSVKASIQAFLSELEESSQLATNTCLAYEGDLKRFHAYLETRLQRSPVVEDVSPELIVDFFSGEEQKGLKPNTLLRRRATLRKFAEYLTNEGLLKTLRSDLQIEWNEKVHSGVADQAAHLQVLTFDQVEQIMQTIAAGRQPRASRDQAILALVLETGLSASALVSLDISDLDLERNRLSFLLPEGEVAWICIERVASYLHQYIQVGRPELNCPPSEQALFVSQMGSHMSRQGIWQIIEHWGRASQIPFSLSPRVIRHTAVLNMLDAGRPLLEIQRMLGHKNPFSTQALVRRLRAAARQTASLMTT